MIDLLLIAALAQAPPPPEPTPPGGDRRDGISADVLSGPSADLHSHRTNKTIDRSLTIMAETLGYYAGARPGTSDADILDRIEEQFGSWLQELTRDDKATVLICLVERVIDPQQVFIEENFFSNANGGELWQLAQNLTPPFQLSLASAIMSYLADGGQR